jgi:molecular chaperone HscA
VLRYLRDTFPPVEEIFAAHASGADVAALISRFQLRERCVQAKVELSAFEYHEELLSELDPPEMLELGRAGLNDLIDDLVTATVDECERMLRELGMAWPDVDRCTLVGGSSRVPLVRERLEARSGRAVVLCPEPELAVVRGATALARGIAWPPPRSAPARTLRPFAAARNLFDEI